MKLKLLLLSLVCLSIFNITSAQIAYPGEAPGQATIKIQKTRQIILENNVVRMEFVFDGKKINIKRFDDKKAGDRLTVDSLPLFELLLPDNTVLSSNEFSLVNVPLVSDFTGKQDAAVYSDRMNGKRYSADLENKKTGISVHWEADLRNGSNYIRQLFSFRGDRMKEMRGITLIKLPLSTGVRNKGTVDGSPLVRKNMFFALEYPLSRIDLSKTSASVSLPRLMDQISTVWGVTPTNQLRRGFLYYVERERAHPYHQNLHYNSWFDISWDDRKFTEEECLDRIKWFGDSLITKRNVPMTGFLFDDGWDDNRTLWQFHSNFPDGFDKLKEAAESYNSNIGVWLSPFGGYGETKKSRLEYGRQQDPPFETNEQGFSLSGPVYYNRFREVTGNFITKYDICMFKFDGVGMGNGAGIVYQRDVEAFLKLQHELLAMKPNLYLSLTTGTWPSVYWLKYGDNIWRGGDDTNLMGEGSKRQQWITYRDADTYKNVVLRGPLFPLNSLMLCGICIADNGNPGSFDMNESDISDEIWSFFATGTNLQELYINPHKLRTSDWNCLAEASHWAKENEAVLADVHWVGGDPAKGEVYGFAAWSPEKAVLSLRNPSVVSQIFEVNVAKIFEIPGRVSDDFYFYDARLTSTSGEYNLLAHSKTFKIALQPFEVKVLNAVPKLYSLMNR
jgi:hypothetical protein